MFSTTLNRNQILTEFSITLNGVRSPDLYEDVQSITLTEDLDAPSMVAIALKAYDEINRTFKWIDDPRLRPGTAVKLALSSGRNGTEQIVLEGEITGLEPEFSDEQGSTLTVRVYDRSHRLLRGTRTHTYTQMTDSQIAQTIAQQNGLLANVTRTNAVLDYVLQNNLSDLEFLQTRSQRIGYKVWVRDKTLFFQPPKPKNSTLIRLQFGEDLLEFSPRLSLLNQVPQVEIHGWNMGKKKVLSERITPLGLGIRGGSNVGLNLSQIVFGNASHQIVDQPFYNPDEAQAIVEGELQKRALHYITGEGTCLGDPRIKAGSTLEIQNVGKQFSGLYYVTAATHTFSVSDSHYLTDFTIRRTST